MDETVLFGGWLSFNTIYQSKTHIFGTELFKLCTDCWYTYEFSIYCGKECDPNKIMPSDCFVTNHYWMGDVPVGYDTAILLLY